jgi:hypothetical protein
MGLLDDAIREHLELKRRRGADAGELSRAESDALGPVRRAPDGTPDLSAIPPAAPQAPPDDAGIAPGDDEPGWEDRTAILPTSAAPPDDLPSAAYDRAPSAYEPPPAAYEAPEDRYEPPPIPAAPVDPGYTTAPAAPADPGYATAPAAPVDPGPGYTMPPALPPLPEQGYDEHPPGFEDLDEQPPLEQPPAPPARDKPRMRLRLRNRGGAAEPPAPSPPPALHRDDPPTAPHQTPPAAYEPGPPSSEPPPPRDVGPAEPAGEDLLEETPEFLEETPDHDRLWFEQRPPRDFDFDK